MRRRKDFFSSSPRSAATCAPTRDVEKETCVWLLIRAADGGELGGEAPRADAPPRAALFTISRVMKETNFFSPLLCAPSGTLALSIILSHLLSAPLVIFPSPPALDCTHALDPGAGPRWELRRVGGGGRLGRASATNRRRGLPLECSLQNLSRGVRMLPLHSGARDPRLSSRQVSPPPPPRPSSCIMSFEFG